MDIKQAYVTTRESVDDLMNSQFWNWFLIVAAGISAVVAMRNIYVISQKLGEDKGE